MILLLALACSSEEPAPAPAPAPVVEAPAPPPAPAPAPAAAAPEGALKVDLAASKLTWKARKVTRTHDGSFGKFDAWLVLDGDKIQKGYVEVDMASVATDSDPKLGNHLRSPDFFDVGQFPTATMSVTSVTAGHVTGASYTVTGLFKLHGVEREIGFPAEIAVGEDAVKLTGTLRLNRQDWGIVYPGMPDDLIANDVDVALDVSFPRPKAAAPADAAAPAAAPAGQPG